ncbi:MAG: DUF5809 family protein [Halanaeroarchaeum sp.]
MKTRGYIAPETEPAVRAQYAALAPAAKTVTKEIAEAATDDSDAYREIASEDVYETAQQALFASLLEVQVGTAAEYKSALDEYEGFEADVAGTETVARRAWHPVEARETVVAVSFEEREDAAVASLQRQAFGRFYRPMIEE